MSSLLHIDGSLGEGGGQVVRTSIALSMITGRPIRLTNIRAGRRKPGLLRQHLTGLRAAVAISGATVDGDALGSCEVTFRPGPVRGGGYHFAVGTAGSANLVLQTILPALWFADTATDLTIEGGTHNSKSPSTDVLIDTYLPTVARMGPQATLRLERHGFYPAGGGCLRARVEPAPPSSPLSLVERGPVELTATALVCNVPGKLAKRQLSVLERRLPLTNAILHPVRGPGPGNVVAVTATTGCGHVETFTGFGERRTPAEAIAEQVAGEVDGWLQSAAVVGEHTADQLLIPMALSPGGSFSTTEPSLHTTTNIDVIERFLPVRFTTEARGAGWVISVRPT